MTIDVVTGAVVDDVAIPGDRVLSVNQSGTNILFIANGRLKRLSLADLKPVVVSTHYLNEAAW